MENFKSVNVISDIDTLDELSMDELKGGILSTFELCCIANSHCNKNCSEEKKAGTQES